MTIANDVSIWPRVAAMALLAAGCRAGRLRPGVRGGDVVAARRHRRLRRGLAASRRRRRRRPACGSRADAAGLRVAAMVGPASADGDRARITRRVETLEVREDAEAIRLANDTASVALELRAAATAARSDAGETRRDRAGRPRSTPSRRSCCSRPTSRAPRAPTSRASAICAAMRAAAWRPTSCCAASRQRPRECFDDHRRDMHQGRAGLDRNARTGTGARTSRAPAPLAAQGAMRKLGCRGVGGLSLRVETDPSPRDTKNVAWAGVLPSDEAVGYDYRRSIRARAPGIRPAGPAKEPGYVRFDHAPVGAARQGTWTRWTPRRGRAFYPDPIHAAALSRRLEHYWGFYVEDASHFSVSFGPIPTPRSRRT